MGKPEIIFVFPIALGGVSSFNFNIINNSKLLQHFYSKVVLIKNKNETRPSFAEKFDVDEQIVFEMSDFENQYHLQKRLNGFLGNASGAIVTDNGLTMESARRFNNPKTVFSLIHDYYYVNQQVKLNDWADVVIAHSSFFSDAVFASNPSLWVNRVFYIPYGVKQLKEFPPKNNDTLNVVFLGRLEGSKGVLRLFEIQKLLYEKKVNVNWTIIGKGSLKNELVKQWKNEVILFYEPNTTTEVYDLLKKQDVFVFPTTFEGTPVAILEALACGVVTIVNDLPGGIRDIVTDTIGFRCNGNTLESYANNICKLNADRKLLKQMQENCFALSQSNYDVFNNADNYFKLFLKYEMLTRKEKSEVKKLKKLDKQFIPNWITNSIRKIK